MQFNRAYVYILSNKYQTVFYVGVTNDLEARITEHKEGTGSDFTKKYQVHYLMFYEIHSSIVEAIKREKTIKRWKRDWKLNIIKTLNPEMIDLSISWEKKHRLDTAKN